MSLIFSGIIGTKIGFNTLLLKFKAFKYNFRIIYFVLEVPNIDN